MNSHGRINLRNVNTKRFIAVMCRRKRPQRQAMARDFSKL